MRTLILLWISVFSLVCFPLIRAGESYDFIRGGYNFTYLDMEDGLLHNFIDDIYKDARGFIWVSTGGGGLSRYDGYEFIHYTISSTGFCIKSNFVRNVCEDALGRLWIASEGGVDILDMKSGTAFYPEDKSGLFDEMSRENCARVFQDSQKNMWVAAGNSLYKFTLDDQGNISVAGWLDHIPHVIYSTAMADVDRDGEIWFGYGSSVRKIRDAGPGKLIAEQVAACLEFPQTAHINCLTVMDDRVWIGTVWGLFKYNRNGYIENHFLRDRANPLSLSQSFVTDIARLEDGTLLVATLRGLNLYDSRTAEFHHIYMEDAGGERGLNCEFINCLFPDNGMVWVGTEIGGINRMVPRKLKVTNYAHSKDESASLSRNLVNAVYEDSQGTLWVGTVEGGLNKKNPGGNGFTHFDTSDPAGLAHRTVSAITEDGNRRLWVGTWGKGVHLIDLTNPAIKSADYITSAVYRGFAVDFIGALQYDPINDGMWIGTNQTLCFYDIQKNELVVPFEKEISGRINMIGSTIYNNRYLWMGSAEGVYVIDLHSAKEGVFSYKHLKYKLDDPGSDILEKITSVYQASDGTLWLGSNGSGLYKLISDREEEYGFRAYTMEHGLVNNHIRGILEDDEKRLWISTNNGLSCFDPVRERFTNYKEEDGLIGNQFYWNAYCRSVEGTLYFGSSEGLVALEGDRSLPDALPEQVLLTRLSVLNEEVRPGGDLLKEDISTTRKLVLHERNKSFSLEFSSLNYGTSTGNYSYQLVGFDKDWVEVPSSRRFAAYTNLSPGNYLFQVKYRAENGEESAVTELPVVIKPYFYKTCWFGMLVFLALGLTGYRLYDWRIETLRQQKEMLRIKVEERTRELEGQKQLLQQQATELYRQNEMLKEQNEKITHQKGQLLRMSKKVQELTMDKLAFFTNITHEFRTPITLIIGPIERALKLSNDPKVIEQLNFVERNSKFLLSLVNQLMDFRKADSGKFEINKNPANFPDFLETILSPFREFASERNIGVSSYCRMREPVINFDADATRKVLTNLVSNAIKFTPDGGNVRLYVASCRDKEMDKEHLYMGVRDTGIGIPEEELPKVFNRFFQADNQARFPVYGQSGTGIGLYLCKRIVHLHGGMIKAKNNRNGGTSFRILLPLSLEDKNLPQVVTEIKEDVPAALTYRQTGEKLTILVVEDNRDMREYIRSILSDTYKVVEAAHGAEALTILTSTSVDFIISDLMMPVMDGMELSRRVKANFSISHIPFLMLTAKTAVESRVEGFRTGVDEYLLKPFDEELLMARIENILSNRRKYQEQFRYQMDVEVLNVGKESDDKKFLEKVMEIIRNNYKNSYYEVSDFVEDLGVSKSRASKKMQSLTGQSCGQFIRNYRLNIARELILKNKETRNMNISEIAYEVGFNDPKYFTRCFTRQFGVTPSSLYES